MRNMIFAINMSADGCCDHTAFNPGDEVLDYFTRLTREAGTLLYGRKTYELMVPYWPDVARNTSRQSRGNRDFAEAFVSVPEIVVFSRTRSGYEGNARFVGAEPRDEIPRMKQGRGKPILTGGVSLPSELMQLGLIDELRILVHPVVAGKGRRLFYGVSLREKIPLTLLDVQNFPSGSVALRYAKQ